MHMPENIIDIMHILLHADTEKDLFIHKCNIILKYFKQNKLCFGGDASTKRLASTKSS